jgi:DNA polymerase-1
MSNFLYWSKNGEAFDFADLFSAKTLSFDVEASGLHMGKDYPVSISVACSDKGGYVTPITDTVFRALLADESRQKIAFNAKYDRSMLKKSGLIIDNLCDPMIAAHLLENPMLNLRYIAGTYLGGTRVPVFEELSGKITNMSLEELAMYSGPHSALLLALWPVLEKELKARKLTRVFWDIEMPLVPVLSDMELDGVAVDPNTLRQLGVYFDGKIELLNDALCYYASTTGINFNSPAQISDLFYKKLGIPPDWKVGADGRPSVRAKRLEEIKHSHPIIPVYLQFKRYITLKNTFVNGLLSKIYNGRIYGSFNQTRTRTSRLSSSDPNLQNIPQRVEEGRKIRTAFIASEGHSLVKADADQIELRVMADRSQDKNLIEAFRAGRDIHTETAIRAYGSGKRRFDGKTLNYQTIFGGGSQKNQDAFFRAYPGVKEWTVKTQRQARENLYIRTMFGRIRVIDEYVQVQDNYHYSGYLDSKKQAHGDRETISTVIQGSTAEIVKIGMAKCWKVLRNSGIKFPLQVHDEFVLEVPDKLVPEVAKVMYDTMCYHELSVPITVSILVGKNWGQMGKWDIEKGAFVHGN